MKATFTHLKLQFKNPAGTSRGVMQIKNSWILTLSDGKTSGIGEISILEGLSPDFQDLESFERKIESFCAILERDGVNFDSGSENHLFLETHPSIKFGLETALLDFENGGEGIIFKNSFTTGNRKLPINGLIWMGSEDFMQEQIEQKLSEGFTTLKMKVGATDFDKEYQLLESIRARYSEKEITLRVDANGAFSPQDAPKMLEKLAELKIHSIEQPIKPGNWAAMKELCASTPIPIALDEELIGIFDISEKIDLLETIRPQYIILKPSLHGGISGSKEWIKLAEERKISWWMTSALESNIGLNAICQFTAEYANELPQGLGTGSLYLNNIESDLAVENGFIFKDKYVMRF
jgi:o-succinylbenzoate synthase